MRTAWNKGIPNSGFKQGYTPWNKGKHITMHPNSLKNLEKRVPPKHRLWDGKTRPEFCGENHPLFGKKHSQEAINKIKEARAKQIIARGEKHYNWQGGISPLSDLIRALGKDSQWSKSVFIKDNFICQECYKRGGKLEAHHIKAFSIILKEFLNQYSQFSPIEDKETLVRLAETYEPFWDISNGKTLCIDCHKRIPRRALSGL